MAKAKISSLTPVAHRKVEITGGFWAERQRVNAQVSIPHLYEQCRKSGRIDVWKLDWQQFHGDEKPHIFWDSDVAKWLESAAYALHGGHAPAELRQRIDEVVDLIVAAQQPDGYINSYFTLVEPDNRWSNLRDQHELYCAGHLTEAAVAHFEATGDRKLLDAMCRYHDHIASVFGTGKGQKRGYPGHQEIELALVMLHRVTGDAKHLALARYFVDERGNQPHYFDVEAIARGDDPAKYWAKTHDYTQSKIPVREQRQPTGHAVRGMYLYSAMADLAAIDGDDALLTACRHIIRHTVERRMYVTGGLGSSSRNEGYTRDFDLPNEAAYAETCAAIGLVFFAQRMLNIERDGWYGDIVERALYNNVLSGVSLAGDGFFYTNPLESAGDHHRWGWFHCVCCPPNLTRLIASLGGYLYASDADTIFVHQYVQSEAEIAVGSRTVRMQVETEYPWDEQISLTIAPDAAAAFTLALRLPGWCRRPALQINGKPEALAQVRAGYVYIRRTWQRGDRVSLHLSMPVELVQAHPQVSMNAGRVALQRGPVIYCLEEADNGPGLNHLVLPGGPTFVIDRDLSPVGGVPVIMAAAVRQITAGWDGALYRPLATPKQQVEMIRAVPYFCWDNRTAGEMLVWLRCANV